MNVNIHCVDEIRLQHISKIFQQRLFNAGLFPSIDVLMCGQILLCILFSGMKKKRICFTGVRRRRRRRASS
ncbi:hypothetical protein DERP_006961 [Dermatophagoides pteronyssinus]|uniref:Uncharacterized protein n=1 Tax=Dermatophagoides pteronyssinus TaxID=6956 RepID=A0ABQ8JTR8_DERPT|nr:hypothetical protein DERP_006961 [Dermatophagoides pteronyssinus]